MTLLEIIIVIVLLGILALVGSRSVQSMDAARQFQYTVASLETLRTKLIGNPAIMQSGYRSDFGFFNVTGAFPDSLSDLQNPVYWVTPIPDQATKDAWNLDYAYDGPTGGADSILTVQSTGADYDSGGTGFNTDLYFEIPVARYTGNTVRLYIVDRKGTILDGSYFLAGNDGSVAIVTSGISLMTYVTAGYWEKTNCPAGPCGFRLRPNSGVTREKLLGKDGVGDTTAQLFTIGVIYPKAGYSANGINVYEVRLPGALS